MKQLLAMRHAKSDWEAVYDTDYDRPLNRRGVRSAELMGRLLAARKLVPDLVITSSAVRARDTAQLAIDAGGWDCEIRLEPDFYGTGAREVVGIAAGAPDVDRLMVVGHQPTWSMVVQAVSGEFVDMKTAAVAVIDVPIETWADLPGTRGELVELFYPRAFFGGEYDLT